MAYLNAYLQDVTVKIPLESGMDYTWDCKHLVAILGKLVVEYNNFDSGCWVYYHNAASICQLSSRKFPGPTSLSP